MKQYGLPRKARLQKRSEYERVYQQGEKLGDRLLLLFMLPNELGRSRVGVTVSRKHGKAVRRNRLKRLLKEAFRLSQHELPRGFDYVLIPRPRPEPAHLQEFQRSLKHLAARLARRFQRQDLAAAPDVRDRQTAEPSTDRQEPAPEAH